MRKNIVAGNWKMNKTLQEGIQLAQEVKQKVAEAGALKCEVILGVPFIHLTEVVKVAGSQIAVAAQNAAAEVSGAYTGEVSAAMVKSTGAGYVILGHSERRSYYGETNAILNKKVQIVLTNGLVPIFCIGEVLAERESNSHFDVVKSQLTEGLFSLPAEEFTKIVLAYEPVWAIGTGKTATSAQAQEMHLFIRNTVAERYGNEIAQNCSILYGGSCNEANAAELFANPDVDGGLIGGASLVAEKFIKIITAF